MKNQIQINKNFDIITIDALNYCYKYNHTYKNLFNLKGGWTGLYYGFFSKIYKLKKEHSKAEIIIAWDRESKIRKKIDEYYKANRNNKQEKMLKEMRILRRMLSLYGIKQYYKNGYEADDIIANIVRNNPEKKILIASSDKDLFQLLTNNVFILRKKNPKSKEAIYSKEEIEEDFNIIIENYTLYKAIVGDSGDNVSGIYRINRFEVKKFVNYIDGDLLRIYSITRLKRFKKIKKNIEINFNKIELNYELVKLYSDFNLREIEVKKDLNKLVRLFEKYELKQALIELLKEN